MVFKNIKISTPSQRNQLRLNRKILNLRKEPLLKALTKGCKNSTGRNNSGKITVFHKGGGVKKKYRSLSFHRSVQDKGIVCSVEHDPNRSAFIASVFSLLTKRFFYIIAPKNLKIGDIVKSGANAGPGVGNSLPLQDIPLGTVIHNVSLNSTKNAQVSRAAGSFSVLKEKFEKKALVQLTSEKKVLIPSNAFAVIGEVSNSYHFLERYGKAGYSRWKNKRPTVRGVAMNPIDHPHGGGEGKKSGQFRTPWGKPNKKR